MQIQRKLQIQIENQGKHLQMMFEQQREMGDSKFKASSSPLDEQSAPQSNTAAPSPQVDNLETSKEENEKLGSNSCIAKAKPEESSQDASTKQMVDEAKVTNEHEAVDNQCAAPPTKRVKS